MTDLPMDYFDIGIVVNVHGLAGEIKVMPTTDDPSRFALLDSVEIFMGTVKNSGRAAGSVVFPLENVRPHKNVIILKLTGVSDRDAARELVGGIIKVPRSEALPLVDNEYYHKDLIGMSVFTDPDTDVPEELGNLVQIISTGANDVYVVRSCRNDQKREILIPAVKECILSVNLAENKMTVRLMEGLLEL